MRFVCFFLALLKHGRFVVISNLFRCSASSSVGAVLQERCLGNAHALETSTVRRKSAVAPLGHGVCCEIAGEVRRSLGAWEPEEHQGGRD